MYRRPCTAHFDSLAYANRLHTQRLVARVVERVRARPANLGEGSPLDPVARRAGWVVLARWAREGGHFDYARENLQIHALAAREGR